MATARASLISRKLLPGEKLSHAEANALVEELYQWVDSYFQEKIVHGPFMSELTKGTLPPDTIRLFWKNWYYFVSEINNFNGIVYQRFLGFYKRHPDLYAIMADKVADELIHPEPPGHILVVIEQGEVFGISREEMIETEMLAECRAWTEWFRGLAWEANMAEFWAGHQVEQCVGQWAALCRQALKDHYGYTDEQLVYFKVHEEADLEVHESGTIAHADANRITLTRLLESGEGFMRPGFSVGYCARMTMEYFRLFFDACYNYGKEGQPRLS